MGVDMRQSFTLLEVLIVMTIITMLTAVAAVRLAGPYQAARLEEVTRRCEFIDSRTRAHARAHGVSCEIVVSIREGRIHTRRRSGRGDRYFEFSLPRVVSVRRVVTLEEDVATGTCLIDVSAHGAGPAYALCLSSSHGVEKWILIAGMTGRIIYARDESHVREVFWILRSLGNDTR